RFLRVALPSAVSVPFTDKRPADEISLLTLNDPKSPMVPAPGAASLARTWFPKMLTVAPSATLTKASSEATGNKPVLQFAALVQFARCGLVQVVVKSLTVK